jgi:hypothetical protein
MKGNGIGSGKEIRLLTEKLRGEEHVLAIAGATGEGIGVLACTDQRLLFLFQGIIRSQWVEFNWNQIKGLAYDQRSKQFAVFTTKITKRAKPAAQFTNVHPHDADQVSLAVQHAAAAPRLEMV